MSFPIIGYAVLINFREVNRCHAAHFPDIESAEEFAKNYAAKWLLIALTRAVDSLIIQIDDRNSYIGKKLYEIHKKSKDYVSWTQN